MYSAELRSLGSSSTLSTLEPSSLEGGHKSKQIVLSVQGFAVGRFQQYHEAAPRAPSGAVQPGTGIERKHSGKLATRIRQPVCTGCTPSCSLRDRARSGQAGHSLPSCTLSFANLSLFQLTGSGCACRRSRWGRPGRPGTPRAPEVQVKMEHYVLNKQSVSNGPGLVGRPGRPGTPPAPEE